MKPIYFPYTYVSDSVAQALEASFGKFVVYRPLDDDLSDRMQSWRDREVVEVRVPVSGNENELKSAIKNYLDWADIHTEHSGEKSPVLKTRLKSMSLSGELSSSKIVADIREKVHDQPVAEISDPVSAARIFLYFAQEFDRQNHELNDELIRYDHQQGELFRQLKMEDDPAAEEFKFAPKALSDSFTDYLISDRLEAWFRIFCQDPDPSAVFVTHNPAILAHLLDKAATATRVMHSGPIPLAKDKDGERNSRQERLALDLSRLVDKNQIDPNDEPMKKTDLLPAENAVSFSVYLAPDQTPHEFFAHCAGIDPPTADCDFENFNYNHTLIALIQE